MSDVTLRISEEWFGKVVHKLLVATSAHLPFKGESPGADDGLLISDETLEEKRIKTYLLVPLPWFGVEGEFHIVGADAIEFNDSDTFTINELDIAWDKLVFKVGLDIPALKFGGFCLFEMPDIFPGIAGGCLLDVPEVPLFTKTPDIELPLDLSPIFKYIVTEISAICSIETRLENIKGEDFWAIHADPVAVDFDLVDIQDTLGQAGAIVGAAIAAAVLKLEAMFPAAWVTDVFLWWLQLPSLSRLVADVLDLEDDVEEWLMKRLEFSIGIDNLLAEVLFDAILDGARLFKVPRRLQLAAGMTRSPDHWGGYEPHGLPSVLGVNVTIPEVRLPIAQPDVHFTDVEMIVMFDIEA